MELTHPLYPVIGILIALIAGAFAFFIPSHRKDEFDGGIRAANTDLTRELPIYQKILKQKKILLIVLLVSIVVTIVSGLYLVARPARTKKVTNGVKRRDIFLCLDVSYSLYDLNYNLTEYLKGIVTNLKGDRFGICMFNTSTVVYVPLTDDYDYVVQRLDELSEYFTLQKEREEDYRDYEYIRDIPEDMIDRYDELNTQLKYFEAGTLVDNLTRGSSLIGEGLSSCLYSFPSIEDSSRTRVILFATDNANSALFPEVVDLKEACELCKKNNVTVFGIYPDSSSYYYYYDPSEYDAFRSELINCVALTGGETYIESKDLSVEQIVENIRAHEAMTVDEIVTEKKTDEPFIPYIFLFSGIILIAASSVLLKI